VPAIPAQQTSALLTPVSSPEMDALAGAIAEKIHAQKVTSIVVVGGGTAEFKVSDLSVSLRDGLNEALAKRAADFRVLATAEVREVLKRNRVSESMIYCNTLADWIAAYSQADAAVIIQFDGVKDGRNMVSVEMFDERKTKTLDQKTKHPIPDAKFQAYIVLSNDYAVAAGHEYYPPIDAIPVGGKNGITLANCIRCPRGEITDEARQRPFFGTVHLEAVVGLDGRASDIRVTKPIGSGMDGSAVNAILGWKFQPSVDSGGHLVATRVPIEMAFQLY
jgi:TonB family protein